MYAQKLDKLRILLGQKFLIFFFVLTSGFYELPFFPGTFYGVSLFRDAVIVLAVALMAYRAMNTSSHFIMEIAFGFWIAAHALNIIQTEFNPDNVKRIAQAIFIMLFIRWALSSSPHEQNKTYDALFTTSYIIAIAMGIFLVFTLAGDPESNLLRLQFERGFNGNRVNFSIWLAQLICILLLSELSANKKKPLEHSVAIMSFIFAGIFVLHLSQIVSGGRIGFFASWLAIALYAFIRRKKVVFAFCLILLVADFSFMAFVDQTLSAKFDRNLNLENSFHSLYKIDNVNVIDNVNFVMGFFDKLSSGRVYLLINGIQQITFNQLIFGSGVKNFITTDAYGNANWVHVTYVNYLGEVGVIGFLSSLFICTLPLMFYRSNFSQISKFLYGVLVCWTLVSLLQPELLLSQIGTSVIYWVSFASILRSRLRD